MPGPKQINRNKLAMLASMMGAAMAGYEDKFLLHRPTRTEPIKEKPSQTSAKAVPEQLHDFTIKGITFKARSRQDAIKQAIHQGVLPNKKKKRKK